MISRSSCPLPRAPTAAHFWFAPGVEVRLGLTVPTPPPRVYRVVVRVPFNPAFVEYTPSDIVPMQEAEFALAQWSPSGEVAHYERRSGPPAGWRWLAVNGAIRAERLP